MTKRIRQIEQIVDRTIASTSALLSEGPQSWSVAREGVERIYDDLELRFPGHPALERLKAFLADRDRLSRRQ